MFGVEAGGEPGAELGGGDGPGLMCEGSSGYDDPGVTAFGGVLGDVEQGVVEDLFGDTLGAHTILSIVKVPGGANYGRGRLSVGG